MENFMAGDGIRLSFSVPLVPPLTTFLSWLWLFLFRWTRALQCHWQMKNNSFWLFLLPNINSNSCNMVDRFLLVFFSPLLVLVNREALTTFICFLYFYFFFFILLEGYFLRLFWVVIYLFLFHEQFGQVGVGDNVDHSSPLQVKFPHEQAHSYYCSSPKLVMIGLDIVI